jgi:tRNA(fMet)-specific endonuclease VapC
LTILDTDILVALLKGAPEATEKIRSLEEQGNQVSTTLITAYELLKGAQISYKAQENLTKVRDLFSSLHILELSYNACEEASKIYRELRKTGTMIGEFDILIAAITRACDETLLTQDEHFELIRGMKIINW